MAFDKQPWANRAQAEQHIGIEVNDNDEDDGVFAQGEDHTEMHDNLTKLTFVTSTFPLCLLLVFSLVIICL